MSWRWRRSTLLNLQQHQQQHHHPIRWLNEYHHHLPQSQIHQLHEQQQLQHQVQQHQQLQYPLQRRQPSPWINMSFLHPSEYSQARSAQREMCEQLLPTRTIQRTTHDDYRKNVLYHARRGNNSPLEEPRTEEFYPDHRNRRLLNGVHEAQTGLYDNFMATKNIQQTTDNDYIPSGQYYHERQNKFSYHDERGNIFHTEERNRGSLDESNELQRRRIYRSHTPCPQNMFHRRYSRDKDRSVGPDHRRYRSTSVGPVLRHQRNYDTYSRGNQNNGEDKMFFKQNNLKSHSSCSNYTDVGKTRENNSARSRESRLCDENRHNIKHNTHHEKHQPRSRKRKSSVSPPKEVGSVLDEMKKKRRNVCKQERIKTFAEESPIVRDSISAASNIHTSPLLRESLLADGFSTAITRTVVEEAPESSCIERDENAQSTNSTWHVIPLENVALNRSPTPVSSVTAKLLNVHAERTHAHKVGERNHRLRSFREEEEEDEEMQDDDDNDDEDDDENDNDGGDGGTRGEGESNSEQRDRDLYERTAHDTNVNTNQQSTGECVGEIECARETKIKHVGEKEVHQQYDVPEYNSNVPVGRSLLKWTLGLRCRTCHKFFLKFEEAEEHCQTLEHYNNYVKRINELQFALNIDPMDGPKALELESLLEDEPPASAPPENSCLSETCSGHM